MKVLSWCYYHSDCYPNLVKELGEVLRGDGLTRGSRLLYQGRSEGK